MNDAYFVPAKKLVEWINDILKMNITKVQQCANGAIYAQLLDVLYPKTMPLAKINFAANSYTEYLNNYKIIQQVLEKHSENKPIPVEKLVKGGYQDNLEFLQWMHNYFHQHHSGLAYDAVERRSKSKGGATEFLSLPGKENDNSVSTSKPKSVAPIVKPKKTALAPTNKSVVESPPPTTAPSKHRPSNSSKPVPRVATKPITVNPDSEYKGEYRSGKASPLPDKAKLMLFKTSTFDDIVDTPELAESKRRIAELEQQLAKYTETNQDLSHERTFYYEKILKVEDLITNSISAFGENVDDFQREAQDNTNLPPLSESADDRQKMMHTWKGVLKALYSPDTGRSQ